MGGISAQEVLAGPHIQRSSGARRKSRGGSFHLFLVFVFPKEMGQKEVCL